MKRRMQTSQPWSYNMDLVFDIETNRVGDDDIGLEQSIPYIVLLLKM